MGSIKDRLNKRKIETVTLAPSEMDYLFRLNNALQAALNQVQQAAAEEFLRYIAINRLEYPPDANLLFKLDPAKTENNLEIAIEPK